MRVRPQLMPDRMRWRAQWSWKPSMQAVAGKGDALIVMTNGPKLSAYVRGTRFGWIHDRLGLAEVCPDLDPQVHGDAISFEFIASVDPDWLIVLDR
jgi:iron complex transport system substrate-binding protein